MYQLIPEFINIPELQTDKPNILQGALIQCDLKGFSRLTIQAIKEDIEGVEIVAHYLQTIFAPSIHLIQAAGGGIHAFQGDGFLGIVPHSECCAQKTLEIAQCLVETVLQQSTKNNLAIALPTAISVCVSYGEICWQVIGEQGKIVWYMESPALQRINSIFIQPPANVVCIDREFFQYAVSCGVHPQITDEGSYLSISREQFLPLTPSTAVSCHPAAISESQAVNSELISHFYPELVHLKVIHDEYRQIITGFVQIAAHTSQDSAIRTVIPLAERYKAYLNKIDLIGNEQTIMLIWGAPRALERSADLALEFTLEVRRRLGSGVRIGLSGGIEFVGLLGIPSRCEYTAIGVSVNRAARLVLMAGWGEIWHDSRLNEFSSDGFISESRPDVRLHGFDAAQAVSTLQGKDIISTIPDYPGVFIGRDAELITAVEFLRMILQKGEVAILLVEGLVGIGKSRFIHRLLQLPEAHSFRVYSVLYYEIQAHSFSPLFRFLHQLTGILPTDSEANLNKKLQIKLEYYRTRTAETETAPAKLSRQHFQALEEGIVALISFYLMYQNYNSQGKISHFATQYHLQKIMVDLVTAEASCHPTLLYIDNIQLMNKENFIWINQLCERKSELNLGIILTRRMDYQTHEFDHKLLFSKFIRICLEDLSPDGIQQLILKRKQEYGLPESIFDQNPDLVERIARLSSGNPLFAEQLLLYIKSMNGSAHKKLQSDMSFTELPLNLNYTILARLDCMESVVKSIVQIAAVLGMEFSGSLLGTAYCTVFPADAELLKPGIELCKEEHILFLGIDGLLRFSHAMFREIIYTSISKKRLRSYHIVIAELISAIPASERESSHFLNIAEHYRRAEQPALAAENYYQYAYRLGMLGQKREAVGYYEKAIHLLTNLADRNEKLLALAMGEALHIYLYVNEIKRAYNLLSKLESNQFIKGNSEVEALVYLAKGIIADRNGDYETALKLYQDYLAKYPQSSIQESIDIYFSLGHIYNKTRDLEKALEVYEYILSTTSRENHLVLSALYGLIGGIKSKLGDQETAIQYLRWADSYYKDNRLSASRIDILGNLGLAYKYKSEYDKSYDAFQECLALAERIQVPSEIAITCNNLAILLMETNRFKESISYFDRLEAILDVVNDKALLLNAKLNRGLLLAELGKFAQAEAVLSAMIAMNKQKGFAHLKATAFFYLSLVYKRQDRSMEAIRLLNKAIVVAKKYSMGFMEVSFWVVKAEILVGMGAYQKAQPLIDAVLEQALGLGRDDCWLEAKLHDAHSKFMQSQKLDKAMIIGLLKLLPNLEDEEQIAYLHLELWQLAQLSGQAFPECGHSPEKHFQEAKQRLQSLISQAPKWEYLKRMQLLESAVIK